MPASQGSTPPRSLALRYPHPARQPRRRGTTSSASSLPGPRGAQHAPGRRAAGARLGDAGANATGGAGAGRPLAGAVTRRAARPGPRLEGDVGPGEDHPPRRPERRDGADHRRDRSARRSSPAPSTRPAHGGTACSSRSIAPPCPGTCWTASCSATGGSFTGATQEYPGLIRGAEGGTLFLDEIGEMPLDLQPKLLRFLESGEILPIGETRPLHVNVRVVAATNADLDRLVPRAASARTCFTASTSSA